MDIKKVDIKIIGSGYSLEKEETLKNQFKNLEYPVFVSGYPTCAAGVELFWTIVIFVSTSILQGQIYDWYKCIRDNIIQNIKHSMGKGAYQGDITLISTDCDITIRVNNGAGFRADSIDYQSLLEQINKVLIPHVRLFLKTIICRIGVLVLVIIHCGVLSIKIVQRQRHCYTMQ